MPTKFTSAWPWAVLCWCCLPLVLCAEENKSIEPQPAYEPTTAYEKRELEGWQIIVNKRLLREDPETAAAALKQLEYQLYEIVRRLPEVSVTKLREIPIWLELDEPHHACAVYHPEVDWLRNHGMNPDKARCVELSNAKRFVTWTREQPMMVLHELAHGFHDRFMERGHANPEIKAIYDQARAEKLYDEILSKRGKKERAYGMNNPAEYFAESTEAFFGTNDFFPFVIAELRLHDPRMYELQKKLWLVKE
jgi:hypothetical protein